MKKNISKSLRRQEKVLQRIKLRLGIALLNNTSSLYRNAAAAFDFVVVAHRLHATTKTDIESRTSAILRLFNHRLAAARLLHTPIPKQSLPIAITQRLVICIHMRCIGEKFCTVSFITHRYSFRTIIYKISDLIRASAHDRMALHASISQDEQMYENLTYAGKNAISYYIESPLTLAQYLSPTVHCSSEGVEAIPCHISVNSSFFGM